ncbi:MAG: hypothetical protein ACRESJ_29100 [Pseudomonas sp.]
MQREICFIALAALLTAGWPNAFSAMAFFKDVFAKRNGLVSNTNLPD